MSAGAQRSEIGKTAWLSQGFEELLASGKLDFDVIIVGSGYGGAIAAAELAGCKDEEGREITLCILERGREYLSGMFPSQLGELPTHVRFSTPGAIAPRGSREGVFDVRIGEDVNAIVGNGLGGGSLINAGVMEKPRLPMLWGWPRALRRELFATYLDEAQTLLGAAGGTIDRHPDGKPDKLVAFEGLAPGVRTAAITVGLARKPNKHNVMLDVCKRCGDCATGCNHGAKNSLDAGPLARAEAAGARIYTGATVLRIERETPGRWAVHAVHTDEYLRKRQGGATKITAGKLILAAGTFGSTEILFRSQKPGLRFSDCLGGRFSANGDSIAVIYDHDRKVNAVADETDPVDGRGIGPTITGMLDKRSRWLPWGHVIQEIAIPGPLRRVFEETVTTVKALHELGEIDRTPHLPGKPDHDPFAVDARAIARTSAFVMMGNDGAKGRLELDASQEGDGGLKVVWEKLRHARIFARQHKTLEALARRAGRHARVLPNPLWKLLPDSMQFLIDYRRGPPLTVHPLGGCALGRHAGNGVVNDRGQVFKGGQGARSDAVWEDLVVLDGSIVRNALAINPALTIAALALRASRLLREQWRFSKTPGEPPVRSRDAFSEPYAPQKKTPTEVQIIERMSGEAMLAGAHGRRVPCVVELTLKFRKKAIAGFVFPDGDKPVPIDRKLEVRSGTVRVFRKAEWEGWRECGGSEEALARLVELEAPVEGSLTVLDREASSYEERRCRALGAWWHNRGKRDLWQALVPGRRVAGVSRGWILGGIHHRIKGLFALASRGGEIRRLGYDLKLLRAASSPRPSTSVELAPFAAGARISGIKRLTYGRRSNPWRQLMRMELERFPGLVGAAALELDQRYLAQQRVPLMKIVGQNDQVSALSDVASLVGYFVRLLLHVHMWSFRRPDPSPARKPERLPGAIPGRLPKPSIEMRPVPGLWGGKSAKICFTRYLPKKAVRPPVVLIHGYSASGTTFAHPAVRPCMAEHFCSLKRDVWVLDLRTSSGMPTAKHPWIFEEAALVDIPFAIDLICRETGAASVDVFAHCMGAAMFSMAVLAPPDSAAPCFEERKALPERVRRAVLSQIAPVVVMSPANVFRGYAMSYLRHFLPLRNYQFEVRPDAGLVDQLIDRLLATLPYPEEEFDIENPPQPWRRTPFVGTRHRMDALYGRDFSLADKQGNALLADEVLEHIDDLFGPLSIETVSQAIHFARTELVTNYAGRNAYVQPDRMHRWRFPTLSIHGKENGLSDVATLERFRRRFEEDGGIRIDTRVFEGFGHQDSLIGKRAGEVFAVVSDFLRP